MTVYGSAAFHSFHGPLGGKRPCGEEECSPTCFGTGALLRSIARPTTITWWHFTACFQSANRLDFGLLLCFSAAGSHGFQQPRKPMKTGMLWRAPLPLIPSTRPRSLAFGGNHMTRWREELLAESVASTGAAPGS